MASRGPVGRCLKHVHCELSCCYLLALLLGEMSLINTWRCLRLANGRWTSGWLTDRARLCRQLNPLSGHHCASFSEKSDSLPFLSRLLETLLLLDHMPLMRLAH